MAPLLAAVSGLCLAAIGLRHARGTSLSELHTRGAAGDPIDRVDKALGLLAAGLFLLSMVALVRSYA